MVGLCVVLGRIWRVFWVYFGLQEVLLPPATGRLLANSQITVTLDALVTSSGGMLLSF